MRPASIASRICFSTRLSQLCAVWIRPSGSRRCGLIARDGSGRRGRGADRRADTERCYGSGRWIESTGSRSTRRRTSSPILACEHLTQLERAALAGLVERPIRNDPELDVIRKRGFEHEARFLADLRAEGRTPVAIELDGSAADRGEELRAAADRDRRRDGRRRRRHLPGHVLRRHLPGPRRLPAPGRGTRSTVALGAVPLRGRGHQAGPPRQGQRGPPDLFRTSTSSNGSRASDPSGSTSPSAAAPGRSNGSGSTTTWPTTGARATGSWRRWPTRRRPRRRRRPSTRPRERTRSRWTIARSAAGRPCAPRAGAPTTTSASSPGSRRRQRQALMGRGVDHAGGARRAAAADDAAARRHQRRRAPARPRAGQDPAPGPA